MHYSGNQESVAFALDAMQSRREPPHREAAPE
jgi:hypothetical protein